jgi:peptidoglycan/xylan/chitin deacetylase (PgdA/CDA1 family)
VAKARTIDRGPSSRKMVALTFDAGADRGYTERILDTLRDTNVKATFGMTGRWAEQNPALVQRMVAEGHLLMNHTYDHSSFTGYSPNTKPLTAEERRREIERTETVIRALTGVELQPYFRPPYGDYDEAMLTQLGQLGYSYSVMWTVDSLGWNGYSADRIIARCLAGTVPGAILLFHVGADSQDSVALPELIRQLKAAGYSFGTIAELVR